MSTIVTLQTLHENDNKIKKQLINKTKKIMDNYSEFMTTDIDYEDFVDTIVNNENQEMKTVVENTREVSSFTKGITDPKCYEYALEVLYDNNIKLKCDSIYKEQVIDEFSKDLAICEKKLNDYESVLNKQHDHQIAISLEKINKDIATFKPNLSKNFIRELKKIKYQASLAQKSLK
jgi:hypothetical protein